MLGILWKDLKVMRMQTAILTSIFLMMTVASVWNTGRQDDISFFLNFFNFDANFFHVAALFCLGIGAAGANQRLADDIAMLQKTNGVGEICIAAGVWFGFSGSSWDYHSDFNGKCVIICVGNAFRHFGDVFSVHFVAIVL